MSVPPSTPFTGTSFVTDQAVEQLGVVQHGVVAADLRVLPTQGVEAVRAGDHDLAVHPPRPSNSALMMVRRRSGRLTAEQEFVARASCGVAGAGLTVAEHEELHPAAASSSATALVVFFGAVVQGTGTAHPEQVLEAGEGVHVPP